MSRIAFCETGFVTNGNPPALLNGWFSMRDPVLYTSPAGYPYTFDPADIFRLNWNIKQITLTADLVATPTGGGGIPVPIAGSVAIDSSSADETGIITGFGQTFPSSSGSFPLFLQPAIIALDDLAIPTVQYPSIPGVGLAVDSINGFSLILDPSSPTGVVISSTTIPSFNGLDTTDAGANPATWSGTYSIEATEYWTYDGVFDGATGSQLLTPAPQGL